MYKGAEDACDAGMVIGARRIVGPCLPLDGGILDGGIMDGAEDVCNVGTVNGARRIVGLLFTLKP